MKWKSGEKLSLWLGLVVLGAAALGLRCLHLEDRPMHTDEAVHAVILGEMLESGVYHYNPHDSHGPTLYYLSYPILRTLGVHDLKEMEAWHLRLISALIGTTTLLLLALWAKELGTGAVIAAATLFALAAPFVYYQRYFIHEGLFVLLILLLLRCLWSWYSNSHSIRPAIITGIVTALLFATKETSPLVIIALALAACGLWLMQKNRTEFTHPFLKEIGWAFFAFVLVFMLFYSSFGTNLHGFIDFFSAQLRFVHRAGGEGHEKPWWTYLSWLLMPNFYTMPWSGLIIFGLAAFGAIRCWKQLLVRFLFFFTLALGMIYSVIPYKTPWLEIDLLAPAILLAGVGANAIFQVTERFRFVFILTTALVFLGLGRETWQTCFAHAADARNPLAYSPTAGDIDQLVTRIGQLQKTYPHDSANIVQVISTDYWPLPWYLRRLQPVGYWNTIPENITGDILVTSPDLLPALQSKIGPEWKIDYFGLRADVLAIVLSRPGPHE